MIAKLSKGSTIKGALNYNEKKVAEGSAELLSAHKFGKEKEDLSFNDKIDKFKQYTVQNPRAKVNSYHYSLNFHENDRLDNEQLKEIAGRFMKAIKFADQPYLVYRHHDSGHPHIHIVSTNIQADGKRINDSWNARLMRNCAEEIERDYNLTLTGKNLKQLGQKYQYPDHDSRISPVEYPENTLRNKISDVVAGVHNAYKYKSFEDYNELLSNYNLKAIRLNGRSIKQDDIQTNGLAFQTVKNGKETGVPIYASEILHLGKFNIKEVDKAIAKHSKEELAGRLEKVTSDFLEGQVTYKPSSLHKQLQANGFSPLGKKQLLSEDTKYLDQETKAVVGLKDIGDPKVRSAMKKKRHSFDMSKEEGEGITKEIQDFYQQTKKENRDKYYLESRMINDLDKINFKPLHKALAKDHAKEKIDYNLNSYLAYKQESLEEIQKKEKAYFKDTATKAFVYTAHLSENDRNKILDALDINVKKLGTVVSFSHKKYPELEAGGSFQNSTVNPAQKDERVGGKLRIEDLKMLKHYMLESTNEKPLQSVIDKALKYKRFPDGYQLLKDKDQKDFQNRYAIEHIGKYTWREEVKPSELVSSLSEQGILIKKDKDGKYLLGVHGFKGNTYQLASKDLKAFLDTSSYSESDHDRIKGIMDDHFKKHGKEQDGQPNSIAMIKETNMQNAIKPNILQQYEKLDKAQKIKEGAQLGGYGESTQKLSNEQKKRKRKRSIL